MHQQLVVRSRYRIPRQLFAAALVGGLLATAGSAAAAADPAAKPASSCVVCHTDVEKIKAEAANIKVPTASALQAGKG